MIFIQNVSALCLANNENGKCPTFTYTAKLGLDRLPLSEVLQNPRLLS